jgi:hypothetical protein
VLLMTVHCTRRTKTSAPPLQPEGRKVGKEGLQVEGESAEWLPVGPQKTALLRRLKKGLEDVAFDLQTAPFNVRFPPAMVSRWP